MSEINVFQDHGGKVTAGVVVILGGLFKWLVGREVRRFDAIHSDHETRIRVIEGNHATKDDIRELRETMTEQHGQILTLLRKD